ncbi:MAG: alanine racemase [Methylomonas sp.]|nr:alanine racemase [Methylomonas sp.]PPD22939.1 MAG: alanine racemase [Methylomonas sp.]PPD26456.1 MAG: alanine racemase [Methylomonas sp.]PPD38224.1 MAG: alanine racemase [Methylomonas sp.]PPD41941.1 MAG: alanine racemase [Methylomonas sp.]
MTPAAYVHLDLDAARHNLAQVRCYAPNACIMAVIKANAYGHGIERVASALQNADGFAVARVDEGVKLRRAGFTQPITVLQGFVCTDELRLLLQQQLAAVVHTPQQIAMLQQHVGPGQLSIWLKMDTGMNRLGFKGADFNAAYQALLACAAVQQPIHLITHFANADDLLDDKTRRQIDWFNEAVKDYPGERSIANSAGIMGWPTLSVGNRIDWVRPGLMLYGCSPFAGKTGADFGLKPVMSLHSRLIAVKDIAVGETVGYSGTWLCQAPTRLGVVSIGYGDGYHRHAASGTPVLVNGKRVPLIGRVSMDMITVDLGSQPEARPGDPVVLWGDGLAVEEVALHADTIPYTLLCGITQRVAIIDDHHG